MKDYDRIVAMGKQYKNDAEMFKTLIEKTNKMAHQVLAATSEINTATASVASIMERAVPVPRKSPRGRSIPPGTYGSRRAIDCPG